jgi:hypothetical protein
MADFNRVRAGSLYRYNLVTFDQLRLPHNVKDGDIVRVVNLDGCPKANTMRHAHVVHLDGTFGGLVCTNSLRCKGSK